MTRRLRVAQVIARMNVGGPAVLVASLMRGLDPDRFDVRLITGFCAEDEADYLETQATDLTAIRIDGLGRSIKPKAALLSAHRVAGVLRDMQPDIVHTHTAKAGVVGRVAAKLSRCGAGSVHTYHGHLLNGYFSPAKTRAVIAVERGLAHATDRLVCVAPQVRDDLVQAGIGRLPQYVVIPPGGELGPLPSKSSARAALGLPSDRPIITMMGRLTGIKRPDRFAEAAAIVHESRPEAWFAVAGSGDLADDLAARMAQLPVTMLGWCSDVEMVLAASDALVLTSDNEGTPLSLIQAGMAGLPVVATRVGAVPSVVAAGQTGILCAPTSAAVAAGIVELLADPSLARRLGDQAQARMHTDYGMDKMIAGHVSLYQSLTSLPPMEG